MPGKRKRYPKEKGHFQGQSLLEMALMLPFLLVLVVCTLEFGRLFYTQLVITNAAREGAYYVATHESDYDPVSGIAPNAVVAAEQEADNSGIPDITVSFTPINCCTKGEYSIAVTVETDVEGLLVLGFLGNVFTLDATTYDTFPLSASVEMMVQ